MTSYPGQPAAPKKTLIWLAITSFVLGLVLTAFFVWRIVETVPQSPQAINGGATVHLDKEGLTIYSSLPVLPPQCEAKDANGANVPLERPTGSETITIGSETWYVVSRSVDPVPAGDYVVSCADEDTVATFAVGPRASVVGFVVAILGAVGSFLLFFILGTVLLVVSAAKRRRTNRPPTNTFPGGPGYPPPGYPPPGGPGYPPPGGPGYPPPGTPGYPPPGGPGYPPPGGPGYPPPGGPGYPPPGGPGGPGGPGNPPPPGSTFPNPNEPPPGDPGDPGDPNVPGVDPRYPGPTSSGPADSDEPPRSGVDPRYPGRPGDPPSDR